MLVRHALTGKHPCPLIGPLVSSRWTHAKNLPDACEHGCVAYRPKLSQRFASVAKRCARSAYHFPPKDLSENSLFTSCVSRQNLKKCMGCFSRVTGMDPSLSVSLTSKFQSIFCFKKLKFEAYRIKDQWRRQLWGTGARAPPKLPTRKFFEALSNLI
jgi:hypothetical protein